MIRNVVGAGPAIQRQAVMQHEPHAISTRRRPLWRNSIVAFVLFGAAMLVNDMGSPADANERFCTIAALALFTAGVVILASDVVHAVWHRVVSKRGDSGAAKPANATDRP
jgi:hypothetical protein